jgi:hypothetical protein
MRRVMMALGIVLVGAAGAVAGPLDGKSVSAQAQWVVHLDADAVHNSTLGQKLYDLAVERDRSIPQKMADALAQFKFDLRKDLHGITVYGPKVGSREAVVLVYADVDRAVLEERVKQAQDYKAGRHGAHELHSFKAPRENRTVSGAILPNVVVLAEGEQALGAALDVLDGKSSALAKGSPLGAETPAGALLVFRAAGISEAELPFKSPLVQQSESIEVAIGEYQGKAFVEAAVRTKTPEAAQQLRGVLEGLRAAAMLSKEPDPEAKRLMDAIKIDASDKKFSIEVRMPVDETLDLAKKAARKAVPRVRAKLGAAKEKQ